MRLNTPKYVVEAQGAVPSRAGGIYCAIYTKDAGCIEVREVDTT